MDRKKADGYLIAVVLVQHRSEAGVMHSQGLIHHTGIPAHMPQAMTYHTPDTLFMFTHVSENIA